jgi:putative membrane protein
MGGFGPGMMGWGWLAMLLGLLAMLAFIAVLVVGGIWLIRTLGSTGGTHIDRATPTEILRRRLAAGEISPEEYDRVRQLLEQ